MVLLLYKNHSSRVTSKFHSETWTSELGGERALFGVSLLEHIMAGDDLRAGA